MNHLNRRASSLIELMILVASTSVILVLTINFIQRTLAWSQDVSHLATELRQSQQLTAIFLDDIQQSESVTPVSDSEFKLTQRNGESVSYQFNRNELMVSPSAQANGPLDQDQVLTPKSCFVFLPDRLLTFKIDEASNSVHLNLSQTAIDFDQPKTLWTIEGYLNTKGTEGQP